MAFGTQESLAFHRSSIVVDTLSNGPSLAYFTPAMEREMNRLLDAGVASFGVINQVQNLFHRAIVRDPAVRAEYRSMWAQSGVTVSSITMDSMGHPPWERETTIRTIASFTAVIDACRDFLRKVTRADDIRQAAASGGHGIIFNMQNTLALGNRLQHLDELYDLGVRIIQLTYNNRNHVGDGCTERTDGGLSNLGINLVKQMNELGIMVDLSHCGRQTALDAAKYSTRPVNFTHTFAADLCKHDRGKTDDLLKAIAATGGYIGILAVPFFIGTGKDCDLNTFADHVEHVANLVGVEHIGVGTDTGMDLPPRLATAMNEEMAGSASFGFRPEHRVDWHARNPDFNTWLEWPNITATLLKRFSPEQVRGILGGNFVRIFEQAIG